MNKTSTRHATRMIGRILLQGLAAILPLLVTVYIIYWTATAAETVLGGLIKTLTGVYFPGIGLLAGVALVFAAGVMVNAWFVGVMLEWFEGLLQRVPVVKTLYNSVRDFVSFLSPDKNQPQSKVVMVDMPGDMQLMGLVTREAFDDLPDGIAQDGDVAVYLPMSYQIGGFTVMVSRDRVHAVDMSMEDAMRFMLTAGVRGKAREASDVRNIKNTADANMTPKAQPTHSESHPQEHDASSNDDAPPSQPQ